MNILIEQLPTSVEIDGHEYEINSDYRVCLNAIIAFEDNDLTATEKAIVMIETLYPVRPDNLQEAFKQGMKFLNGGEEGGEADGHRLYSFEKDSSLIFAAFQQTHSIDLSGVDMHWWKFLSLFMDLGKDTTFSQLVGLRKRVKTGKATREERQAAAELGDVFDLEDIDTRTLAEKELERQFLAEVAEGKRKRDENRKQENHG